MSQIAITVTVSGQIEEVYQRVVKAIEPAGFGVLTRIDFDKKIKEKLGEVIRPCIIAGACNPKLAFAAYKQSSDVAMLIPCNIVLTEVDEGRVRVEAIRPTHMLSILPTVHLKSETNEVELNLTNCLKTLS